MAYDFSKPLVITDENLNSVRAWLLTWRGRSLRIGVYQSKRCPTCRSYLIVRFLSGWNYDDNGRRVSHSRGFAVSCPNCQRCTVDDLIPDNDNPVAPVAPYIPGWVRCPHCGTRFKYLDGAFWNGERHLRCGQRLQILGS